LKFLKAMQKFDSSGIRKVFDLASKLKKPINLSIGEPDFNVPAEIKNEVCKAIKNNKNKYTQTAGIPVLREKIALKLKHENKIITHAENVIVTSGTSGALHLLFHVLLNPGDEVIIIDPYFVIYKQVPQLSGAKVKTISSYPDFSLPVLKIEKAITSKTKMVIINSPNNPTGKVYKEEELKNLVDVLKKKDILLISDEIYEKFTYECEHVSPASIYKNTITLNGFSKAYALTGLRVGYAAGPKDIISEMIKLQQYTYVCAPSISQYAALKALKVDTKKLVLEYKKRRDLMYKGLRENFKIEKPEGAFYVFPKVPKGSAENFAKKAIAKNLLIVPGGVFSFKDSHFRISFAAALKDLKQGIKILNEL